MEIKNTYEITELHIELMNFVDPITKFSLQNDNIIVESDYTNLDGYHSYFIYICDEVNSILEGRTNYHQADYKDIVYKYINKNNKNLYNS